MPSTGREGRSRTSPADTTTRSSGYVRRAQPPGIGQRDPLPLRRHFPQRPHRPSREARGSPQLLRTKRRVEPDRIVRGTVRGRPGRKRTWPEPGFRPGLEGLATPSERRILERPPRFLRRSARPARDDAERRGRRAAFHPKTNPTANDGAQPHGPGVETRPWDYLRRYADQARLRLVAAHRRW